MAREFLLPDLGSGLQEARIVAWRVAVGDQVSSDAVLCEVETEKAIIEVPVPFDGVVLDLAAAEDETVKVGGVLAVIGETGETGETGEAPEADGGGAAETARVEPVSEDSKSAALTVAVPQSERSRAMPSIRRLAREQGVDLSQVPGTGQSGRITRDDVMAAASQPVPGAGNESGARVEKLSSLRQSIADHMAKSWREIPHCFGRHEVDATRLLEARKALSDRFGFKVPIEALLIRAVIPVLKQYPHFNSTLSDDELTLHGHYHIGVAADTEDGLVVPVVRDADRLSLEQLSSTLNDLVGRAVKRKATPQELSGATFTVNNIGALGQVMGTSIIPHGTAGIVSVGRAIEKPLVRDGRIAIAPLVEITLSFDHRIVDGGAAQRFLTQIGNNLAQPVRFLV